MRQLIFTILAVAFLVVTSQAQTPNGLYCKYDFNNNSARVFTSGSSTNQDYITATSVVDRFGNAGKARNFSAASNQIITYPAHNFTPINNNNFSISCWIKRNTTGMNTQQVIMAQYYSASCGNNRAYLLSLSATNSVQFTTYEAGTSTDYSFINFGNIIDSDWHHIVVSYIYAGPNISYTAYIDGVAYSVTPTNNITSGWVGTSGTAARVGIGGFPQVGVGACTSNSPFNGSIDDIYFYSRILTPSEVLVNYNAPFLQTIRYVDNNATSGMNTGNSWANAYLNLQDALSINSFAGDTIFVMEGTYVSPSGYNIQTNNLKIFGGFHAGGLTLATRDWANHKTILDGDVNGNDIYPMSSTNLNTLTDNATNVLSITANQSEIDGFQIRGGNGSAVYSKDHGTNNTNITLRNCEITECSHTGLADHVGLFVQESNSLTHSFKVENCHFHDLYGRYYVPFFFNTVNNTTMNVLFINNLVNNNYTVDLGTAGANAGAGGGIAALGGSTINAKIINSTFANNMIQGTGTGTNSTVIAASESINTGAALNIETYNSIFWGNTATRSFNQYASSSYEKMASLAMHNNITVDLPNSTYSNTFAMTNDSQTDPLFENTSLRDYSLSNASAAINAGSTTNITMYIPMYDVLMMPRVVGTAIDLGAIENQVITSVENLQAISTISVYPNPAMDVLTINTQEPITTVRIFTTTGVLVKELAQPSSSISITDLGTGMYILEITQDNKVGTGRFVKQ